MENKENLESFLSFLQKYSYLKPEEVVNVYLFGSRLYGYATKESDWDFIVLINGEYFAGPWLIEKENINANIYHLDYFKFLLESNLIWILVCLFFPKEFIWKETEQLSFQLKKETFKKNLLMESLHNWAKAKKLWREGQFLKAKKNVLHSIRWLDFGEQLIKTGKIFDFESHWKLNWNKIFNDNIKWRDLENSFRQPLSNQMRELSFQLTPISIENLPISGFPLKTLAFISKYGLEALSKEFSIFIRYHKKYPNLVQLYSDGLNSPLEERIVVECNGLILDKDNNYSIVCFPYYRIFNYDDKECATIDWNESHSNLKIYEKIDGSLACLYWYGNEWHVASPKSPDGSDLTLLIETEGQRSYPSKRPCYNAYKFFGDEMIKLQQTCKMDYYVSKFNNLKKQGFLSRVTENPNTRPNSIVNGCKQVFQFSQVFWDLWKAKNYQLPKDKRKVYLFQLYSEKIQFILTKCLGKSNYEEQLVFHGVRDLDSLKELNHEPFALQYGWNFVPLQKALFKGSHSSQGILELIKEKVLEMDPIECNGFILCDENFQRVKVQSAHQIALRKLCWDSNDPQKNAKHMFELVRNNDHTQYLDRFPYLKDLHDSTKADYESFCQEIALTFEKGKDLDVKGFAQFARPIYYSHILFKLYSMKNNSNGKSNVTLVKEYIMKLPFVRIWNFWKIFIETKYSKKCEELEENI